MVTIQRIILTVILFTFALPFYAFSQEVKVTAEIEKDGVTGRSLEGAITVTHKRDANVDKDSFEMGNKKLKVDFVKTVELSPSSDVVISLYHFTLEPQEAGLHELPEISVAVGNRKYQSIPSTYTIDGKSLPKTKRSSQKRSQPNTIVLELENIMEGETTLYPGQQTVVGYRFIFNFSQDLTKEELPLLEATGFDKVGAKDINQFKEGDLNYFEARQVIEAKEPGEFHFPAGVIEGTAFTEQLGKKNVAPVGSRAETKPVTLYVIAFPEKDKPPSFNGAIGTNLQFDVALVTPDEVTVGDKIVLLIKISGKGELSTLPMPEVCCQPGFSGFFRMSDLPPTEEVIGSTKTFRVEMRPLSPSINEIPSLEFSYFNPNEKSYTILKSKPIPLKVNPLKEEPSEEQKKVLFEEKRKMVPTLPEEPPAQTELIEIEGNYPLNDSNLENKYFGTWWVLLIIPFGIGLIFLQMNIKKFLDKQSKRIIIKTSEDFYREAMQKLPGSPEFFNLIQKAFLLRLVERGDISSANISPDYLPVEEAPGKVRALMREIEEKRFAKVSETPFDEDFITKTRKLFDEITIKPK